MSFTQEQVDELQKKLDPANVTQRTASGRHPHGGRYRHNRAIART